MQDRPTYAELLSAVRHFLETDVVPHLEGPAKFHARVAANVVAIVERELDSEDTQLRAEALRLGDLLHVSDPLSQDRRGLRAAVRRLTTDLCGQIANGAADQGERRAAVFAHVRATVREKLAVANPKYLEADDRLHMRT